MGNSKETDIKWVPEWARHFTISHIDVTSVNIDFFDANICQPNTYPIAELPAMLYRRDVGQQIRDKPLADRIVATGAVNPADFGVVADDDLPGGSTPSQYGFPAHATELQDLIEHRGMNFAMGNIFKACYRDGTCSHSDAIRDMRKIIWFAGRELKRLLTVSGK
jgi:hypothetical protein